MEIPPWVPGAHFSAPLPRSLHELALHDLQRGIRLIQKVHPAVIDPQFRIATRDGSYAIAMAPGKSQRDWQQRLELLKDFMAWKGAPYFVLVKQASEPASITATALSCDAAVQLQSSIKLHPLDFAKPQLLPHGRIERELFALLPRMTRTFSAQRMRQLNRWFGVKGKYPAIFTHMHCPVNRDV